jgi:hypothetical protein
MRRAKSAPSISTRNAAADEMFLQPRMPLWVKSRHMRCKKRCPLYPSIATAKAASANYVRGGQINMPAQKTKISLTSVPTTRGLVEIMLDDRQHAQLTLISQAQ